MAILNLKGAAILDISCYSGRQFALNIDLGDYLTQGPLQFVVNIPSKPARVYTQGGKLTLTDGNASLLLDRLDTLPVGTTYYLLEYLGADVSAPSRVLLAGKLIADSVLSQGNASTTIPLQVNLGETTIGLTVTGTVVVASGSGGSSGVSYNKTSATQWIIVHNRGYRPQVSCSDTTGEVIYGDVQHISLNEVHIFHQFVQAGTVYIY